MSKVESQFTPFFLALGWMALAAGVSVALYVYAFAVFEVYAKLLGMILFCALPLYLWAVQDGMRKTPEPEKGWIGATGKVAEVSRMDLHDMEIEEDWEATADYVYDPGQVTEGKWSRRKEESVYKPKYHTRSGDIRKDAKKKVEAQRVPVLEPGTPGDLEIDN